MPKRFPDCLTRGMRIFVLQRGNVQTDQRPAEFEVLA